MSSRGSAFTIGRVAAIVTVAGLTALPFVSCSAGPIKVEFRGHEILRNTVPDVPDQKPTDSKDKRLFEGDDAWLHWAYLVATAAAVAGLFVGGRGGLAAAVLGLAATVAFLVGFNSRLTRDLGAKGTVMKDRPGMTLEAGAYLTLLGFATVAAAGAVETRRRGTAAGP